MTRNFAITVGLGVLLVAAVLTWTLWSQRGAHPEIHGRILKVRTLQLDEQNSLAVVDFRVSNPSDVPMTVRAIRGAVTTPDGGNVESQDVSISDAKRIFGYYKLLGDQYNEYMKAQDKLPPRSSLDRMVVFHFELPFGKLEARKSIQLHIEDEQGTQADLTR